jgi:hypothetical protein
VIFKVAKENWGDTVGIAIIDRKSDGRIYYAKPVVIEMVERIEGSFIDKCLELDRRDAQSLMQQFWDIGLRPEGYEPGDETLKATKYHLEDFRRLVFEARGKK